MWIRLDSCSLKLPTALGIESASCGTMQASWLLSASNVEVRWEELNSKGNGHLSHACVKIYVVPDLWKKHSRTHTKALQIVTKKSQRFANYASNFCELRLRCASFQCYPVMEIWKETCLVPFFAVIFLLEEFMIPITQNEPVPQHQPVFVDQASEKIFCPADLESSLQEVYRITQGYPRMTYKNCQ